MMSNSPFERLTEKSANTSLGRVEIMGLCLPEPVDKCLGISREHLLYLHLTPRLNGARASFVDRWAKNRFEDVGQVFIRPAGFATHFRADPGLPRFIICRLDPARLATWFDETASALDQRLAGSLNVRSARVSALLRRLVQELRQPGLASEAVIELSIAQISIELDRFYFAIAARTNGGLPQWRLKLIDERLSQYGAPPTLAELAQLVNLSVRQLTRAFRTSRGMSLGTYMEERRIQQARQLLSSDIEIKEVAAKLGFASPSSFTYMFRNATGETPRDYRQHG
ncbi:helix-turn-helix transcriptional regulator [Sphingobium bisphenolivorans]|uniref:helix-turn-helix transcriptional regulator n=1 Tax=Sphingobium bisphenolivorans TaxID=1335760 RepID=UPI00039A8AA4|nr:AraC family transcriptional regulator [Sphingobium bisphenolivorans]